MIKIDFFNRIIDNPLNVKRINGDIPTSGGSFKNIGILVVVGFVLAYTFNNVWAITISFTNSFVLNVIILGIVYGSIVFKTVSITILEEKRNKVAFKEYLQEKITNLSSLWEIQKVDNYKETKIGYVDFLNGERQLILKCVPGSIFNQHEEKAELHYLQLEEALKSIVNAGFEYDLSFDEEPVSNHEALQFCYEAIQDYNDPEYVGIFTEILDTIDHLSKVKSSIHNIHIVIKGRGRFRHGMIEKVSSLQDRLKNNTAFTEVYFLDKDELNKYIADDLDISNFDMETLIMNKFKGNVKLGVTGVLYALDEDNKVIKTFIEEHDPKRKIRVKSINTVTVKKEQQLKQHQPTTEVPEMEIVLDDDIDNDILKLMYGDSKVKLG